jgi:hypothetical protein
VAISEKLGERLHSLRRSDSSADMALGHHLLDIAEDNSLGDQDLLADAEEMAERATALCTFIRNLKSSGDEDVSSRQP